RGISPTDPEREQGVAVDGPVSTHDVINEGAQVFASAVTVTGVATHGIKNLPRQQLGGTVGAWERHSLTLAPCSLRRHVTSYRTPTTPRDRAAAPNPGPTPSAR